MTDRREAERRRGDTLVNVRRRGCPFALGAFVVVLAVAALGWSVTAFFQWTSTSRCPDYPGLSALSKSSDDLCQYVDEEGEMAGPEVVRANEADITPVWIFLIPGLVVASAAFWYIRRGQSPLSLAVE